MAQELLAPATDAAPERKLVAPTSDKLMTMVKTRPGVLAGEDVPHVLRYVELRFGRAGTRRVVARL